jgi:isocitrate lyase
MSTESFQDLIPSAPAGRFDGLKRPYTVADVKKLRGSFPIAYTLAERSANKLWKLLQERPYVHSLGAVTGNQAMQMARAGLEAIYLSGWQVAADANVAGAMYPDQSLYPANSGPELARKINKTFKRVDEIECAEGNVTRDWFLPIVADAEAGFGGPLNVFEIMKAYIEAGVAAVHFEDQLASEKKCGHLGGKVLLPTAQHERSLSAARLAADVMGVPTLVVARTDAESAKLITSDVDERDRPFIIPDSRTPEGFYRLKDGTGLAHCISRGLAYAEVSDMLWWETSHPDLGEAREFAEAIHKKFPGKLMAYNCSPSFNWRAKLDKATIEKYQRELGAMGYKYQFVTLAGFHSLNLSMYELALGYKDRGMDAYSELQQREFDLEAQGYSATRHQREVGTGYFDAVSVAISGGASSTTAMGESTESAQFKDKGGKPAAVAAE